MHNHLMDRLRPQRSGRKTVWAASCRRPQRPARPTGLELRDLDRSAAPAAEQREVLLLVAVEELSYRSRGRAGVPPAA